MKVRTIPETVTGKMSGVTLAASLCIALTANPVFAGSIERISVDSGGIQINPADADYQVVSDNGRYAIFNARLDSDPASPVNVYLRDRTTETTELVSIANDGSDTGILGAIDISSDGRYVVFTGKQLDASTGYIDAYVRDRVTGTTELISINSDGSLGTPNKSASGVSISANGRYIAFASNSADIVDGDTNGAIDIFVRDRAINTTQRVSIASDGTQANGNSDGAFRATVVSANGRYIVFSSSASNLVPNDSNSKRDLFVHDRLNGSTERVNLASDNTQGNFGLSTNNKFDLSSDGRYVVFSSADSNLVAADGNGQSDIFVRDLVTGTTELVSIANDGSQANSISMNPAISANGRYVSFNSMASNLVTGGNPQGLAIFVRDRIANTTEMVDVPHDGSTSNGFSFGNTAVSEDGRYIVFPSYASNLVADDPNSYSSLNIFIHDRISGQICQ